MSINNKMGGLPGGPVVKNPPCNARDTGLIPGRGSSHVDGATRPVGHSDLRHRSRACKPQLPSPGAATPETQSPRSTRRGAMTSSHTATERSPAQD